MCITPGNCFSERFAVDNGVRQGGLLSPHLFAVYLDDLSVLLNKVSPGCYEGNLLVNQGWRTYGMRARCGTPQVFSGRPLHTLNQRRATCGPWPLFVLPFLIPVRRFVLIFKGNVLENVNVLNYLLTS